jgi:hypothetical protein
MSKLVNKTTSESPNTKGLPIADPDSGVAKTMNYVATYTQSKNANGNMCASCGFYTQTEERNGKRYGACVYFGNKAIVPSNAWCAHWKKKI